MLQVVKNPPANAEDVRNMGLIPRSGRSPGDGHGSPPFQFFPGGLDSKESTLNVGDLGSIPGWRRSPGEAWQAIVHGFSKSQT